MSANHASNKPGTNANHEFKKLAEAKRQSMLKEFYERWFLLGGWIGGTDTYKRTMWAVPGIALAPAAYHLTARKGLPEPGATGLVMAGHECMLNQWFNRPLKRSDILLAAQFYKEQSAVNAFPNELWEEILAKKPGEDIHMPVDVYGFPGGQTFLPGVPCLSFQGMGGAISYLEPAMCRYFAPIIHATKARIMKQATDRDAEFGLRAAPAELNHMELLMARYVGSGNGLTSSDMAEFLMPELFKSIGTIGHEMMCAGQTFERTLADAEYEMMDRFITHMGNASLLCDLVDAETVGLDNALRVIRAHPETTRVGIRVDSGDIAEQCILYFHRMRAQGITPRTIVFEDEVTPETIKLVYDQFRKETGEEPDMLFPGAGGYWWKLVLRDTISMAFKRSETNGHPNVKFSNSPGKGSLGGNLRVYGKNNSMIIADASEESQGEPLFVQLVKDGEIVYHESLQDQHARAERTWGQYTEVVLSPAVQEFKDKFDSMRAEEVEAARQRILAENIKSMCAVPNYNPDADSEAGHPATD